MYASELGSLASSMASQRTMTQISVAVLKQIQQSEKQFGNALVKMIHQTTAMSRGGLRTDGVGELIDIRV